MALEKKKNSFKLSLRDMFHGSTPSPDHSSDTKTTSSSVLSPQTSTNSLSSLLRKNQKSSDTLNNQHHIHGHNLGSINHHFQHVDNSSENLSTEPDLLEVTPYSLNTKDSGTSTPPKSKHSKDKEKDSSHLSLKRFLKKLKPVSSYENNHHHSLHQNSSKPSSFHKTSSTSSSHASSEIFKKYGTIGKLLGSGASGAVSLITSETDLSKIYAVKKFRAKLSNELELDYKVKVKNEFKIGEILLHQNLIHTYELIKESSSKFLAETEYYIVMEYCKYDFFNLVMSGLMDRKEIYCYFKQIINGVGYLHANGFAHRDLKLDNCVVNSQGILKLIDFGSAVQFLKETTKSLTGVEDGLDDHHRLVRARGIVGSDPYLAPEVFEPSNFGYDPRLVDVWSIAIIFCCMILKRFPWKLPKESDPSYKSFAGIEDKPDVQKLSKDVANLKVDSQKDNGTGKNGAKAPEAAKDSAASSGEQSATPVTNPSAVQIDVVVSQPAVDTSVSTSTSGPKTEPEPEPEVPTQKKLPPRGAERLLRLLPTACRPLIKGMLTIDPTKRFFIKDIFENEFYQSIDQCTQDITTGECKNSEDHEHHLVSEEDLQKINDEKEKLKHIKEAGMA